MTESVSAFPSDEPSQTTENENNSSLIPVLRLIKNELLRILLLLAVLFVLAWVHRHDLLALVRFPLALALPNTGGGTVLLKITDLFFIHIKLCAAAAFVVALPPIFSRLGWLLGAYFPVIGKRRLHRLAWVVSILLYGGFSTAYFVIFPAIMRFLVAYSIEGDPLFFPPPVEQGPQSDLLAVSMSQYSDFLILAFFICGLALALPAGLALASRYGLIVPRNLGPIRGLWYVGFAVVSAALTPKDPLSLVLLLVPLVVLFEIGIFAGKIVTLGKKTS